MRCCLAACFVVLLSSSSGTFGELDNIDAVQTRFETQPRTSVRTRSSKSPVNSKCHVFFLQDDHDKQDITEDIEEIMHNKEIMNDENYFVYIYLDRKHTSSSPVKGMKKADGKTFTELVDGVHYIEKVGNHLQVSPSADGFVPDDPDVMPKFFQWAFLNCVESDVTADILVTIASHGDSWMGYDGGEQTVSAPAVVPDVPDVGLERTRVGFKHATNSQIKLALESAMNAVEPPIHKLALLSFDTSLMNTFTTNSIFSGISELIMASETKEPSHGWDYSQMRTAGLDVFEMSKGMVDAFVDSKHGYGYHRSPKHLGVFRFDDWDVFQAAFDQVGLALLDLLPQKSLVLQKVRNSVKPIEGAQFDMIDMGAFLLKFKKLCEATKRLSVAQSCGNELANIVDLAVDKYRLMTEHGYFRRGRQAVGGTGVSFWFPLNFERSLQHKHKTIVQFISTSDGLGPRANWPWYRLIHKYLCERPVLQAIRTFPKSAHPPYRARPPIVMSSENVGAFVQVAAVPKHSDTKKVHTTSAGKAEP